MLDWVIETREVGADGRSIDRQADEAELKALAVTLDVVAVRALRVTGRVKALSRDRFAIAGHLAVRLVQTCVVTLEHLETEVRESIEVELWPRGTLAEPEGESSAFATSGPEPYDAGHLPLGQLVVEHLAAAIDPFPRRVGAEVDWRDGRDKAAPANPFAVLARLKDKGD